MKVVPTYGGIEIDDVDDDTTTTTTTSMASFSRRSGPLALPKI